VELSTLPGFDWNVRFGGHFPFWDEWKEED
jgi:hypothetical protein